uniref:Uncharacterized protein n=1 Tax=Panagrolaimus sp. ES5 TaxID=591445 RepID=A0AC34FZJ2_9BILA
MSQSLCAYFNSSFRRLLLKQVDTVKKVLNNYTLLQDGTGVRVANPRSIISVGIKYIYSGNLGAFSSNLLTCHYGYDVNFTVDKALRSSMSFAYQYSRNISVPIMFVVFTLNNGTSLQIGDTGSAFNASVEYRNKCMKPANVEIIQINPSVANVNPELGDYFFMHDDPNLFEKFTDAILRLSLFDKSAISEADCIDSIAPKRESFWTSR